MIQSGCREIEWLPVEKRWIDLREAARVWGEIVYGHTVRLDTIWYWVRRGAFPSARTISKHFIILYRSEVEKHAYTRKSQLPEREIKPGKMRKMIKQINLEKRIDRIRSLAVQGPPEEEG